MVVVLSLSFLVTVETSQTEKVKKPRQHHGEVVSDPRLLSFIRTFWQVLLVFLLLLAAQLGQEVQAVYQNSLSCLRSLGLTVIFRISRSLVGRN